jgi:protein-S-isoprenylcysteine O-methyltransferase Ste14
MIKSNRILISRVAGAVFVALLLATASSHAHRLSGSLLFLLGAVLVGIGTVGRLWCSLYINNYKNAQVITQGPYSICRNPLYLFSFLGAAGIGFATETLTFGIGLSAVFLAMYGYVIRHEEEFLEKSFGDAFRRYVAATPRFFPKLSLLKEPESYTVDVKAFRKTMGDALWFIWVLGLLVVIKGLHEYGIVQPLIRVP